MSFANPWAVWFAAALGPVLVAFLVRRWRRRRLVPSVVLYRRLSQQSATRRHFAAPEHLVALLLTLLAVGASVLAALQPQGTPIEPHSYVVVLDTSASMGTRELLEEKTRFERALGLLAEFAGDLNPQDEVALIAMGPRARVVLSWSDEHDRLVQAASQLSPMGSADSSGDALQVADALCQDPGTTEIILVSDGGSLDIPELRCPLRYVRLGQDAANLAITGLTVREADALGLNEIYLAVHNASDHERQVRVELELDGRLVDVVTEVVPADTTLERVVGLPLPGGEILVARLRAEGENALEDDDQAYAVLRPGGRVKVLLVTEYPTTFLAEALVLHPRVDLTVVAPGDPIQQDFFFDLAVVDSPPVDQLPSTSHLLVLDVAPERFGLQTSGRIPQPEIIRWAFDHPLFRFVSLDGVHLSGATATRLPEGARSMMDTADGPLAFLMERDATEILYFTFHPDTSDLPLRVAFVNLVANIVQWAQPLSASEIPAFVSTGEILPVNEEAHLVEVMATSGSGEVHRLNAGQPMDREGVYQLVDGEGMTRALVAVNLFCLEEANLDPIGRLGVGARYGWPEVQHGVAFPWWILVLAAIVFLLVEWLIPAVATLRFLRPVARRKGAWQQAGKERKERTRSPVSPQAAPGQ